MEPFAVKLRADDAGAFLISSYARRFPPPWSIDELDELEEGRQRAEARLFLLRGGAWPAIGHQVAHKGRGQAGRSEFCEAAGTVAEASERGERLRAGVKRRKRVAKAPPLSVVAPCSRCNNTRTVG